MKLLNALSVLVSQIILASLSVLPLVSLDDDLTCQNRSLGQSGNAGKRMASRAYSLMLGFRGVKDIAIYRRLQTS